MNSLSHHRGRDSSGYSGNRRTYVRVALLVALCSLLSGWSSVGQAHAQGVREPVGKAEKIREAQGKLALLAEDQRAALESEIEGLKAELLEFDRQQKADLTKDRNDKIREILLEIENRVSDYAKKENYSLILNDRVLIYGSPAIDLTEDILKVLNKGN